ncbi:DUF4230 domain-containing protein [Trueperella bialowiezensis]|uniref:DUF4230 domain-containing protein n=1 Tax=Trueperella bialowiezensis TaxID=312285 RepID=A0A3S4V7Z4_9ACTO|nr:DUF4230 domain-containing protein [Trueperella bialowiezensis]VEI13967.1 Uncharacterised protein [Trueperella bialowiezensis]
MALRGNSDPEINSTTILNSFEDVAELATQEYSFSGVGQYSDKGLNVFGWGVPLTGKSFLITYRGEVSAGINFENIDVQVNHANSTITVIAEEPHVLDAKIDPNSVEQYDQSFNPINQISVNDVTTFLTEVTDRHRKEAIDGGLLERAKTQAELLLQSQVLGTIQGTNVAEYTIEFQWKEAS